MNYGLSKPCKQHDCVKVSPHSVFLHFTGMFEIVTTSVISEVERCVVNVFTFKLEVTVVERTKT